MNVNGIELDEFTVAYVVAALWSTNDESDESGGNPLDDRFQAGDIYTEKLKEMVEDCKKFQAENMADILTWDGGSTTPLEQAGHDFWLTRNGHGCGFWDGDWNEDVGERLTKASNKFKEDYFGIQDINPMSIELSEEPKVTKDLFTVGEYLAQWGCDPVYDTPPRKRGDGYTFYNYDSEKNSIPYLEECLLPAIERNSQCQRTGLHGLISCLSYSDRRAFRIITKYVKRRIELLKKRQKDEENRNANTIAHVSGENRNLVDS